MQENFSLPACCPLFCDIPPAQAQALLRRMGAREAAYAKGAYLAVAHMDSAQELGVVLAGRVHIVKEDFWGNRSILATAGEGELFGEAFALAGLAHMPVSVVAAEPARVLFVCAPGAPRAAYGPYAARLAENLLRITARKNVALVGKMEHLVKRSTREKLLSYLSDCALQAGSATFDIPFDRQQLADYLAVDRSALSAVLGKLRREGVLDFRRSRFTLADAAKPRR